MTVTRFSHTLLILLFLVNTVITGIASPVKDTLIYINKRPVTMLRPATAVKGTILVLPGWNFGRTDVCEKSAFCDKALQAGYCLIMPEMGKGIYASQAYPETRKDWLAYPQLKFITDTLLPYCQQNLYCLLPNKLNFIYGISTGARGVAQLAIHTKQIFKAGAALSGDYDQTLQPSDNLMRGWYGTYEEYTERWRRIDNPGFEAAKIEMPVYLGHGEKDEVVPVKHSLLFYEQLKKNSKGLVHQIHVSKQGQHDYSYWNSETDAVLLFFNKIADKK